MIRGVRAHTTEPIDTYATDSVRVSCCDDVMMARSHLDHSEERRMRAAVAHGHAEALRRADAHVRAHLRRRLGVAQTPEYLSQERRPTEQEHAIRVRTRADGAPYCDE